MATAGSGVLATLPLLQDGYAHVPYSSLESVIEPNKEACSLALRQTQGTIRTGTPDWQPWLGFFLRSLSEQAGCLVRTALIGASGAGSIPLFGLA
jgi:hypothetical protein